MPRYWVEGNDRITAQYDNIVKHYSAAYAYDIVEKAEMVMMRAADNSLVNPICDERGYPAFNKLGYRCALLDKNFKIVYDVSVEKETIFVICLAHNKRSEEVLRQVETPHKRT